MEATGGIANAFFSDDSLFGMPGFLRACLLPPEMGRKLKEGEEAGSTAGRLQQAYVQHSAPHPNLYVTFYISLAKFAVYLL